MKTKNQNLQELISNSVAEQLNEVKASKSTKSKTAKKEEPKAKQPKETKEKKAKSTKKSQVVKEVAEQQKPSIVEAVISNREVKYIYPDNVQDTLARKKWRQATRNELHKLEREMFRIQDKNSKEYKEAAKKFEDFKKKVLKPEQVA